MKFYKKKKMFLAKKIKNKLLPKNKFVANKTSIVAIKATYSHKKYVCSQKNINFSQKNNS